MSPKKTHDGGERERTVAALLIAEVKCKMTKNETEHTAQHNSNNSTEQSRERKTTIVRGTRKLAAALP